MCHDGNHHVFHIATKYTKFDHPMNDHLMYSLISNSSRLSEKIFFKYTKCIYHRLILQTMFYVQM